jgi:ABC-type Fe3+/spermidine/putrescine transport system ATPase subunit
MVIQKIPSVEIKNVSHSFDHSILFSDFNVSFEKDKITAILGKSGSGKSTLLQIINGMVKLLKDKFFLMEILLNIKIWMH